MPNREGARLLHEQRARTLREATRAERRPARRPRRSVRRAVGRSMLRIGARLVEESAHPSARSS